MGGENKRNLQLSIKNNLLYEYVHSVPQGDAFVILSSKECIKLQKKYKSSIGALQESESDLSLLEGYIKQHGAKLKKVQSF